MTTKRKSKHSVHEYLACRDQAGRIAILESMQHAGTGIPIALANDLLSLEISEIEKSALVQSCHSNNKIALEDFYSRLIQNWHQDIAVQALRSWADKCDGVLWFRLLPLCHVRHIPHRVRYTILDVAPKLGGEALVKEFANIPDLNEQSPAFHALLLQRSIQFSLEHPTLKKLAHSIIEQNFADSNSPNKALVPSIIYSALFDLTTFEKYLETSESTNLTIDLLRQLGSSLTQNTKSKSKPTSNSLVSAWPTIFQRHEIPLESLALKIVEACQKNSPLGIFDGISKSNLTNALLRTRNLNPELFGSCILYLHQRLKGRYETIIIENFKNVLFEHHNPAGMLKLIPDDFRVALTAHHENSSKLNDTSSLIWFDEKSTIENINLLTKTENTHTVNLLGDYNLVWNEEAELIENSDEKKERERFFNLCIREITTPEEINLTDTKLNHFWNLLTQAWLKPHDQHLDALSTIARRQPALYHLCYIKVLGRHRGSDVASLKLLDYIRSENEDELRAVFKALKEIGTPRSLQELLNALVRPNINLKLQNEVIQLLVETNLDSVQDELRAVIEELNSKKSRDQESADLLDSLEIKLNTTKSIAAVKSAGDVNRLNIVLAEEDIDVPLLKIIPLFDSLSSEAKRALRTAMYFYNFTQDAARQKQQIDLSPVVDMQYKALELSFREVFEDSVSATLNRGAIPSKLDGLGYARPIPAKMDEFENFLANLETVRDIPFFSKFKLRKLLRSLCQYQPGKRFTLDGLKAFALFFLCFSRQRCPFGVGNQFPIGLASDQDLFGFVRDLHILQDMRNRAAHEGFQPNARNDIESIWSLTAHIIDRLLKIKSLATSPSKTMNRAS